MANAIYAKMVEEEKKSALVFVLPFFLLNLFIGLKIAKCDLMMSFFVHFFNFLCSFISFIMLYYWKFG